MSQTMQQTLDGRETDAERKRPATMLYCEACDGPVLRSRRHDHEHDLDASVPAYEKAMIQQLEEQIPDHAQLETNTYRVKFHYECVETVTVEATDKSDARTTAERRRTLDGEYMDTIHTRTSAWGDASQASIEYLEERNLLPDDHDVTQEDLERLAEVSDDGA
jgi:hypothetical protein